MHRKIFALLAVLVSVVMVAGVSSGQNKPGFNASRPTASTPPSASSAPTTSPTALPQDGVPVPGTAAWTDGLFHVVWGNSVSKGAFDITDAGVSAGKMAYVSFQESDGRFHVVHGDRMTSEGLVEVANFKIEGNALKYRGWDGAFCHVFSDLKSISGRPSKSRGDCREFEGRHDSLGYTSLLFRHDDGSVQLPVRRSHGIEVNKYILANGEPLLVHCDEKACKVWWGESETRAFEEIKHLSFEGGKVSYVAQNADSTWQVVWNGAESPKLKSIDVYWEIVNGKPIFLGTDAANKQRIGEGVTLTAPFDEVPIFDAVDGKAFYVARRAATPVPAKKL